nr:hypothetical protein [Tanacetum cinerariifolium]
MSSLFADTHNMVAILEKSDAAEGFEQIIDFLNGSYIHYDLTVNPHIYVLCLKQFWNTASVKRSDDVTRLPALVNRKKIVILEDVIHENLQLDDAEGVAFFSSQWKFLIHTLLQSLSAKRTSWKEFSSAMASAVICLSKGQKFNFSKYIFDSLVRNVKSSSKFYMYPRFIQLIIKNQIGDLSTHTTRYISPALTQKIFANMRRVGKGFSGVETPLFEGMLVAREIAEGIAEEQVQADDAIAAAVQETVEKDVANEDIPSTLTPPILPSPTSMTFHLLLKYNLHLLNDHKVHLKLHHRKLEIIKLKARVKRLERANKVKSSKLRRLKKVGTSQRIESSDDMEDVFNQGRMIDDLDKDEVIELVVDQVKDANTAETEGRHAAEQAEKQAEIYHLDLDHSSKVLSMQEDDLEVQEVVEVVTTAKLIIEVVTAATSQVSAASVTIFAAKPSIHAAAPTATAAYTRRRKGVIIRDPKEELSSKTPAETPKLKDKGKARFDANMRFLFKSREEMEEEDQEVLKSINETPAQKAAKRRKLNEEAQEVKDLKKHLEVVSDKDDDVFIEATPLTRKSNIDAASLRLKLFKDVAAAADVNINETPAQKAAKRRKLNEETQEVKDLKRHLEIVNDEDDDVFIEATPLARKPLELMLSKRSKKNTKCVNAADEELTAAKHKLMLLVYCC